MSGFIAMQRDALDHPLLRDAERFRAWFWIVANAAWKPTKFDIRGSLVPIGRGQLCVSIRQLADEWGWSKSAVDRFLTRLETETMIEREAGQGRCILTVSNYAKYQDGDKADRDTSGTPTGTPAGHQRDTKEQGNKETRVTPSGVTGAGRAHRLPDDWEPVLTPASQRIVDGWPPGKFERELTAFRDHAADKGRTSKDWQAAFRTWITKADQWISKNDHHRPANDEITNPYVRVVARREAERAAAKH